ncbi:DUF4224 domain-containing protein [Paludibacterium denitrificans]|uniref:DUF4224 domain-containing protein n=1 Tax=Paludibacterium denitrificans TaxID=2675226 RepID=A0A844GGH2_9NEIS|nr:DUF4224 domain-containing protein [Paludibacterium denitrificans]MTD33987.1 DUF4224 domain-containing protein [Paludibacterium denitrificans]
MEDTIVSFDELKQLSGYKLARRVCEWLEANNIPHLKSASGRPIVSSVVFRQALGESFENPKQQLSTRSINIDALDMATTR